MPAPAGPSSWSAFAREVVSHAAHGTDPHRCPAPEGAACPHGGVFVTLHLGGRLRGCMGTLDERTPLAEAVRHAAICAASQDPRFPPVSPDELHDLNIEVSILSHPEPMRELDELTIGRHGIIVQRGFQRGLFLPQVAVEHHMDKETFLGRCCSEKAGLPADAWQQPDTQVLLFTTEVFRE